MRKAQVLIAMTFVALFGAGAVSALLATRLSGEGPRHFGPGGPGGGPGGGGGVGRDPGSYLREKLGLSDEQYEKLKTIWSGAREQMQAYGRDKRRELGKQRDAELRALLSEEQRAKFDQIQQRYEKQLDEFREAAETAMRQAEQRTREILTPDQRVKYEELLKELEKDRRRGAGGATRPGDHGPGDRGPADRGPREDGPPPPPGPRP